MARVNKELSGRGKLQVHWGAGNVSQLETEAAECLGQGGEVECLVCQVGAQVCTAGLGTMEVLELSRSMLAKMRLMVRGVKRTERRVLGAVSVEISAGDRKFNQINESFIN